MKFSAQELPYTQLESLGLKKKDVLSLPPTDLNALLSGRRSSLTRFEGVDLPGLGKIPSIDAKLSLHRNNDNSVSLRIHPINKVAPNIFDLPEKEIQTLTDGSKDLIVSKVAKENGDKDDMIVQYDPETREYVGAYVKDNVPPRSINNVTLTDDQRNDWRNGKEIEVAGEKVRVDLKNTIGFVGNIAVIGLDGGVSIAVGNILKSAAKNAETKNKEVKIEQTEFETKHNLPKLDEKDNSKKWVKVEDNDYTDGVTVADPNKFVLVDRASVGNKDVISLSEYDKISPDKSQEITPETYATGLKPDNELNISGPKR